MADRYWVGGNGNWTDSDTTNWSASSGGSGGASVPTSLDNVFFDQNSGVLATSAWIGLTGSPVCNNFVCTNAVMEIAVNFLSVYGTFDSRNLNSIAGINTFTATPPTKGIFMYGNTFQGGGKAFSPSIHFENNVTIYGSNTFNNVNVSPNPGTSILEFSGGITTTFESGTTQTLSGLFGLASKILTISGTLGNLVTFRSSIDGNIYTINAGATNIAYGDIKDCTAAGAAIPFDDTNGGINSGNNVNWVFPTFSRYWVGGSGSWSDDDNHWAQTSGGASANGNLPTSANDCFIDALSGFGSGGTITVNVTPSLNNLTSTSRHTHTMSFVAGSTFTVNELRLGGISTNHMTLNSQTPGAQWNIQANQASVDYADIQDSFGKGNTDILVDNCGIDLGNNNGWHFICITGSGASKVPDPKMKAVIQQKTGGSVINFKGSAGKIVNPKPDNSIISFKGSGGKVIAPKGT